MKKLIYLVLILSLSFYCTSKQGKVEKFMEDGNKKNRTVPKIQELEANSEISFYSMKNNQNNP